ncbi:membrane protein [Marivirga tractuosa]|uniref:OmpA/MotB domain protein n=1 Tax=Marivirga tractuosa (strain ATCC 23168 / DSM 4126 / NBRC 15989 / NCIMB 1408 / VKM B-1430 / H-43) TaxID=643867 RepID=E4TUR3_MARTH|nr:OmpA family protein [Marivirga tractuosa]ADR20041.1 OmpA/MotB domain protein [Marivirga tractuosa DSM 4126]BDD15527.1 membrane protein [Marivirga tractuosa]
MNSKSQDVRPIISDDGKKLYLNRRFHPENIRGEKDFQDVWVSQYDPRGVWSKPKNLGKDYNDKKANDLVRASKNDDSLIFVNTKYRGVSSELALFTKGSTDPKELPIDGFYNNNPYVDYDYNFKYKVILMAVERKDSEGNQDLYYSVYQENSKTFSTPMHMGKTINTDKADFAPFLTVDGNTLLFASYGHDGEGSADLFISHRIGDGWDEWTEPKNLGNVINTKFEETFVSIDPSFDYLYYDSYPSGAQNRNIWRATLSEELKEEIIKARDQNKKKEIIEEPQSEEIIAKESDKQSEKIPTENAESVANAKQPLQDEPTTAMESQPVAVKIDQEMDYVKEQERNNQGFLAQIGEKIGLGGKDEEIKLIDAGAKGQKINRNVYFKFDSDKLQGKFNSLLDKISEELEKNPQIKIMLEGHTDAIGGEDINIDLSCSRANKVKDALIDRGINQYRIEISCEGKERPIATNDDEFEGRELNRRVEFYLF